MIDLAKLAITYRTIEVINNSKQVLKINYRTDGVDDALELHPNQKRKLLTKGIVTFPWEGYLLFVTPDQDQLEDDGILLIGGSGVGPVDPGEPGDNPPDGMEWVTYQGEIVTFNSEKVYAPINA